MNKLITPFLSENLEGYMNEQNKVMRESILFLKSNDKLHHHYKFTEKTIEFLFEFLRSYEPEHEKEKVVLTIGARMFKEIILSLQLTLMVFYNQSFSIQRNLLETAFLLDYLHSNPEDVSDWMELSWDTPHTKNKFAPVKIREYLDKRGGDDERKRAESYKQLCHYGTHTSFKSHKLMVNDSGNISLAPYFNDQFVGNTLVELAKQVYELIRCFLKNINEDRCIKELLNLYLISFNSWKDAFIAAD